jgi:hypothetical protein
MFFAIRIQESGNSLIVLASRSIHMARITARYTEYPALRFCPAKFGRWERASQYHSSSGLLPKDARSRNGRIPGVAPLQKAGKSTNG